MTNATARRPRLLRNTYTTLARYFACDSVGALADALCSSGLKEKTRGALWRHVAAKGTIEDIDALVERGYRLDEDVRPVLGRTPLHEASKCGRVALVAHLIEKHGVNPDVRVSASADNGGALWLAAANGRARVVSLLLKHGAHPDGSPGFRPIGVATDRRSTVLLRQLLAAGACVEGCVREDKEVVSTPLYRACHGGWEKGIALLDAAGADWNAPTLWGTPLEAARRANPALAARWEARLLSRGVPCSLPGLPGRPRF